ncbi:hypothetical protein EV424DRAFT_1347487 [Suillus variegatus]|nr:hypothetical protein EV424DRAFT_1347487 [Suillus variegatus]
MTTSTTSMTTRWRLEKKFKFNVHSYKPLSKSSFYSLIITSVQYIKAVHTVNLKIHILGATGNLDHYSKARHTQATRLVMTLTRQTGKHAALLIDSDKPPSKCIRNDSDGTCVPSALEDAEMWSFLERYLKSELSYGQAEEGLTSYLGDQYCEDDWREAKLTVFSGDDDDHEAINNLMALKRSYICIEAQMSKCNIHFGVKHCIFIDGEAGEGDNEEEEEEKEGYEYDLPSAHPRKVTTLPGPSAKHTLSKKIDEIFNAYDAQACTSKPSGSLGCIPYRASWSSNATDSRMYLLDVHRTVTYYVAEHLRSKGFSVTVSPWVPGQLYVVSESPRAIASSLPTSHKLSVKDYFRILDEEHVIVKHPQSQLSSPGWVRIIRGKYKNAMVPFIKITEWVFLMEFLHVGNSVRVITGEYGAEIGEVISTDHTFGSVCLEYNIEGHKIKSEVRLQDAERVFWVGNTVKVVAGIYLGLEGHIIQMTESVKPLQRKRLSLFEAHITSILFGEHMGKCSIVDWFPLGGSMLWFWDMNPMLTTGDDTHVRPPSIQVPAIMVQRMHLPPTIKFMRDRGYDVRPGDVVSVARGPEYEATGVMQSVNVPEACLTILSTRDHTIINVPIRFVMKLHNANMDSFSHVIGKEVFIIGGNLKGYQATLYNIGSQDCTIAVHGQKCMTLKHPDVVTSYGMRLNGAILKGSDLLSFRDMRQKFNFNSSVSDPWTFNKDNNRDNIEARAEKHGDNSPLSWLMKKEFSLTLLSHHALLKVSPRFEQGRLSKRFVSTACPDPFCGANGPAPEGYVAAFCTSNGAGARIQHYHIPASDLSPAHPHKKNQHCLILDGEYRGLILPVSKCNMKSKTVEVLLMTSATITVTLHFDQICLVEVAQQQ